MNPARERLVVASADESTDPPSLASPARAGVLGSASASGGMTSIGSFLLRRFTLHVNSRQSGDGESPLRVRAVPHLVGSAPMAQAKRRPKIQKPPILFERSQKLIA